MLSKQTLDKRARVRATGSGRRRAGGRGIREKEEMTKWAATAKGGGRGWTECSDALRTGIESRTHSRWIARKRGPNDGEEPEPKSGEVRLFSRPGDACTVILWMKSEKKKRLKRDLSFDLFYFLELEGPNKNKSNDLHHFQVCYFDTMMCFF